MAWCASPHSSMDVVHTFSSQGFVILRSCLDSAAVSSFVEAIASDLSSGHHNETPLGRIELNDSSTWPRAGNLAAHRIVEVVPAPSPHTDVRGDSRERAVHWRSLQDRGHSLGRALDALLGDGAWEIPCNGDAPVTTRFWYCPVTMPEVPPPPARAAASSSPSAPPPALSASPLDTLPFHLSVIGPISSLPRDAALSAALRARCPCRPEEAAHLWQPINRRRIVGKGWHVDSFHAHAVVVLILLSDWAPGGGGTALIPGSHVAVYRRWQVLRQGLPVGGPPSPRGAPAAATDGDGASAPPSVAPMPDDAEAQRALNGWVMGRMRTLTEAGRVRLVRDGPAAAAMLEPPPGASRPAQPAWDDADDSDGVAAAVSAVQIVGRAGDVVLMHPLLVHSGTTNLGPDVRLLANGMARVRAEPARCADGQGVLGPMDLAALPQPDSVTAPQHADGAGS